ncbi:MAG: hypothetical protein J6A90_04910 [Clostridia bacterium]|nr:hypothetical protein [Clostridia bacterium]
MAQRQENLGRETTKCYRLYMEALENQAMTGLREKIPECVDFYEGRQWPRPTESTKNLPRPVVNIVKMICRAKKGAILATPVRVQYKSYSPLIDVEKFNSFASSVFREMGQDELDRRAIDDGIKKGSYFFHYYWDSDEISSESGENGALACELIDPLNIFFSNPSEVDEQKQDWIIISSQVVVKKLLNSITDSKLINSILLECCDGKGDVSLEKETMLLLTRYYKKDGEIYCERQTKFNTVTEPFKIIPDTQEIDSILKEIGTSVASGSVSENDKRLVDYRHSPKKNRKFKQLYPIVCGSYETKEGSIYGLGEAEGLIPNQKAINFNIAMNLLNAQQCAWGKYIALPNALGNQKISNVPGQVLIDFSGTGEGIKRMPEGEISSSPMSIAQSLEELTRSVSGTTGVMTGDAISSNLSGAAIAYLQSQAQVPIDELRNTFWHVKRKQGKVVAQFLRHFYFKRAFICQGNERDSEQMANYDEFSSNEYDGACFEVYVEAVGGTKASLASDISLLDTCLKNGSISLETYIRAYPESAITNKEEILKQINREKESELQMLREEITRLRSEKRIGDGK